MNLNARSCGHRKKSNTANSKYIPDYMDWEIVLIQEVPDDESTMWEQLYYDELMPLYNVQRPGQDKAEYNILTKDIKCQSSKEYYRAHNEQMRERNRSYYQNNKEHLYQLQKQRRAAKKKVSK